MLCLSCQYADIQGLTCVPDIWLCSLLNVLSYVCEMVPRATDGGANSLSQSDDDAVQNDDTLDDLIAAVFNLRKQAEKEVSFCDAT